MPTNESAENVSLCVCSRYNFGRPHSVSTATWRRHLQEAPEDERESIRLRRALPEHMSLLPADQNLPLDSEPAAHRVPDPPGALSTSSARRTAALRELAKRARVDESNNHAVGRRKCARNSEPSTSNVNKNNNTDNDFEMDDNLSYYSTMMIKTTLRSQMHLSIDLPQCRMN
ncbi:uncharacterized protein HD556DRAFT_1305800 [Suillus plorans]|uniref:Uncharacterized protein n=2 Tax=Suillus plorans TaxID=116603 RepID=A0A9P7J1K2_9AGAM|nr:uncharacterized protein HD556DRAFT_1305800 [Suillus plorans]KAG1798952.1 hypothetical protein HD556DRAFT_1305800 [Suillus plorans]